MGGRGKDVAMCHDVMAPRVKVIETSYVMISDPSQFKSIVQSLTGAGEVKKAVGRKRVSFDHNYKEEAGAHVAGVAGISSKHQDKRQRSGSCGGPGDSALLNEDSFKEEIYTMLVPELHPMEDQLECLFNDEDRWSKVFTSNS